MNVLFQLFTNSLRILTQNFILLWPFFGLVVVLLILFVFLPENAVLGFDFRSIMLAAVLALIGLAFMAGTLHMAYQAVLQDQPAQPANTPSTDESPLNSPENPLRSFFLLREFFPGVGAYFGRFVAGAIIHLGILLLLLLGFQAAINASGGFPAFLSPLFERAAQSTLTTAQIEQFILRLSPSEQEQLSNIVLMGLGFIALYGFIGMLTMLWPFLVVSHEISTVQAYLKSIRQFFADPFRLIWIPIAYFSLHLCLLVFSLTGNPLLESLRQLLALLLDTWFILIIFGYILQVIPPERKSETSTFSVQA